MDYQVIQIDRHTWRIEEPGVRFFLLEGAERALLIDSGMQVRNAREIAEGLTALPVSLLVTHGDRDHVGSNEEFPVFYMHPAEASNYYNTQGKTGEFLPVWDGETLDDIPTSVLVPAYMISELRLAFTIGFIIYIPFIVIDMVVASTLMSMGMMMLPPTTISMPFKILLFVVADGWNLVIVNLVKTFYMIG